MCNVANATEFKCECDDVTVHLYWPWCRGRTESIVRELSVLIKFDESHWNEKSPNPIAEQTNVTLSYILTVTLLGLIVTIGGDTIQRHKTLVASCVAKFYKETTVFHWLGVKLHLFNSHTIIPFLYY